MDSRFLVRCRDFSDENESIMHTSGVTNVGVITDLSRKPSFQVKGRLGNCGDFVFEDWEIDGLQGSTSEATSVCCLKLR
jgi:hypothetical protein